MKEVEVSMHSQATFSMSRPRDPSTTTTALVGPEIFSFLMQLLKAATSEKRLFFNLLGTLAGAMASCSLRKVLRGHRREKREVESEEKGKKVEGKGAREVVERGKNFWSAGRERGGEGRNLLLPRCSLRTKELSKKRRTEEGRKKNKVFPPFFLLLQRRRAILAPQSRRRKVKEASYFCWKGAPSHFPLFCHASLSHTFLALVSPAGMTWKTHG